MLYREKDFREFQVLLYSVATMLFEMTIKGFWLCPLTHGSLPCMWTVSDHWPQHGSGHGPHKCIPLNPKSKCPFQPDPKHDLPRGAAGMERDNNFNQLWLTWLTTANFTKIIITLWTLPGLLLWKSPCKWRTKSW